MRCEDVLSDLPAYVAAGPGDAGTSAVERHLATCRSCTDTVRQIRDTVAVMRTAPLEHAPPPGLEDDVLSLVEIEPVGRLVRSAAVEHDPPIDLERRALEHAGVAGRPQSRWQRTTTMLAPGLAAAVALLGWLGANWRSDADLARSQLGPLGEAVGTAELSAESTSASGPQVKIMKFAPGRYRLVLVCDDVPEAPTGHHYAVWLEGASGRVPVGAFDVDAGNPMAYPFPVAVDPADFPRIVITLESEYDHALKPGVPMWAGEIDLRRAIP